MPEKNTHNKPTISDVGREAGVSQTAVSYVLSGSYYAERLKPETRRKILEAAKRLGYSRNSTGAALKRGYSDNVVLLAVTWELAAAYANTIVALPRAAVNRNLTVNVHVAGNDAEAAHLLENIPSLSPYGLILVWDSEDVPGDLISGLKTGGLPIIDLLPPILDSIVSFTADREQGWYLGTRHLIDLGHEQIGFITNSAFRARTSNVKLRGYQRALEESGIPFRNELIEEVVNISLEAGYESMFRLLSRCPEITALVSISDPLALGAIAAAGETGRVVPDDISVVSGGASKEGAFFRPRLTDIVVPDESTTFAGDVLDLLTKMRSGSAGVPKTVYKPMSLIIRESTGPAPCR